MTLHNYRSTTAYDDHRGPEPDEDAPRVEAGPINDEDIIDLARRFDNRRSTDGCLNYDFDRVAFARALLSRYGAARVEVGDPDYWTYIVNGHHRAFSPVKPPDDAYDEGTLEPLFGSTRHAVCQGVNCGTATGEHSPECILEAAEAQGWGDSPEADAARKDIARRHPSPEEIRNRALDEAAQVAFNAPITAGMLDDDSAKALAFHASARIRALKSNPAEVKP